MLNSSEDVGATFRSDLIGAVPQSDSMLTLRTMVLIYLGFAVLMVWTGGANAGGEAAHLGGAVAGFLLIRNSAWLARLPGKILLVMAVRQRSDL